ncbi:glycine/D-amino acid oxidase-like deaminating enzyme [Kribbella orskensis]|uniref:Glycine/D-amino acid oxidase-like deaminating enzyme n=1 Tax=Kribbella orskensis TaxID=2512216 RepID=A0ABY2BJY8_9ACTN|nr:MULTISPECIES: FAD-binding oxidoreductase [Kribbella]TCN40168.1 glycine/D-amino acid oxidase-like deaminating enzyme [Kribbella sp. VKM Ac-2500]TCO22788.1 glycine/D-amino acid oxidase-like deaminating enzyme [Kribbella orskensis]
MVLATGYDVVVVGAGIVGAACAEALAAAGVRVLVVDRGGVAGGTTAAGEGNVLVSDKEPGPELDLAIASRREWPAVLKRLPERVADVEWEPKGGLVVATTDPAPLEAFAEVQRSAGVDARVITPAEAFELEPLLTRAVTTAAYYPDDAQLQPVLAATALLAAVRARGREVRAGVNALAVRRSDAGRVTGLETDAGVVPCGAVVNACGPWAGAFSEAAGGPIQVLPRRGMILVTAPLPVCVRHKVYDADYVGAVGSGEADLQTSTVVESTRGGTVLIGSSRERIGFDDAVRVKVLRELARKAVGLFPFLAGVPVMRAYGGFRPYAPDHLPVIGADPRIEGLWHATGHEGAGIGLAASTGRLITELFLGLAPHVDPNPFRIDRPALLPAWVVS